MKYFSITGKIVDTVTDAETDGARATLIKDSSNNVYVLDGVELSKLYVSGSASSADDDDGGTGANSIIIYGVNASRESQIEIVVLNGTSNVVTATTWLGINRAAVYLAGSGMSNAGNITITATTGGTNQGYIPAGAGTTEQLIFFSQTNHQVLVDWLVLNAERISGGTNPVVTFKGWVYSQLTNCKYEVFRQVVNSAVLDSLEFKPSQPLIIGEKSVFWIEATTDTNNTVVSGRFSLIEVRDVDA